MSRETCPGCGRHGVVSMGAPPPVPFDQLPAEVQAEAFDADGNVVVPDYDG